MNTADMNPAGDGLPSTSPGRILIVDDDALAHETIRGQLSLEGYDVLRADDGREAVKMLEADQPDLIISDVMMPNLNGFELCTHIKTTPSLLHLPVVLVTALYSKEDLLRGFDAGADDFISKPVRGTELRARVRSLIRIKRQYDELQSMISLREELSNMIVHDLKTPLTSIIFTLDHLKRTEELSADGDEFTTRMIYEAQRLDGMIDDLLMTAKSRSGKLQAEFAECRPAEILQKSLEAHQLPADSQENSIEADIAIPDNFTLLADANLLRRTFDNLLRNAVKHTLRDGVIRVSAKTLGENEYKHRLEIEIRDNGLGIPAEFRNGDIKPRDIVAANRRGVAQIELGLAFCKLAVEAHRGTFNISENPDGGSIFRVRI